MFMVEARTVGAVFSIGKNKSRENVAFFPEEPLIKSPWLIWTKEGTQYSGFVSLKNKKIGVVEEYSYTPEFLQFIHDNCTVIEAVDDHTLFKLLKLGKLDYIVAEKHNGEFIIEKTKTTGITNFPQYPVKVDGLYIMFMKTSFAVNDVFTFNKLLTEYKLSKDGQALYKKYFQ